MSRILGISCNYHDAAAALVVDGEIVAAAEEERFSRRKHDPSVPAGVLGWIADEFALDAVDHVVFYERPLSKLDRVQAMRRGRLRGFSGFHRSARRWAGSLLWVESDITRALEGAGIGFAGRVEFLDHHHSHAASAFYPSPFPEAAVLCLDGVGEWATATVSHGRGSQLTLLEEGMFPHSLGLFYAAFTSLAGFRVNSGEYKLMGLAPYGDPTFVPLLLDNVITIDEQGGVRLALQYFDFLSGEQMFSSDLCRLLFATDDPPPMAAAGEPTRLACDLAASAQAVCDLAVARSAARAVDLTGLRRLALAGGVALNCVSTGRLLEQGICDEVFVQPAASDAGGALGAALAKAASLGELGRSWSGVSDAMRGSFLGPSISREEILAVFAEFGVVAVELDRDELDRRLAGLLSDGALVGVARGRMEFGPRALGNRSILADARSPLTQRRLNLAVKQRESFRPFAPAVLAERAGDWFEFPFGSPFMTVVAALREDRRHLPDTSSAAPMPVLAQVNQVRSMVPAVTHVDYSARTQLVVPGAPLAAVLEEFDCLTGVPMLVNTSFNRRGEPIVRTAFEAYRCFWHTELTHLVLGDFLVAKADQHPARHRVPPDVALEAD